MTEMTPSAEVQASELWKYLNGSSKDHPVQEITEWFARIHREAYAAGIAHERKRIDEAWDLWFIYYEGPQADEVRWFQHESGCGCGGCKVYRLVPIVETGGSSPPRLTRMTCCGGVGGHFAGCWQRHTAK